MSEINIIDVILTKDYFGRYNSYKVLVDRMPVFVYSRGERESQPGWNGYQHRLAAHDCGFYDFMVERPGSSDAFAGRKFAIKLDDGGTLECNGQVWDESPPDVPEAIIQVGVATREQLENCYVFYGGRISKAKLDAWLSNNKPSRNYYKYDPKHTIEWLDQRASDNTEAWGERRVSAARARKLKKRGVTIRWRGVARYWYPWYERRKSQLLAELAVDAGSP